VVTRERDEEVLQAELLIPLPEDVFCPGDLTYVLPAFRPLRGEACVYLASKPGESPEKEQLLLGWTKNLGKTKKQLAEMAQGSIKSVYPGPPEQAEALWQKYRKRATLGKWLGLPPREKEEIMRIFSSKLRAVLPGNGRADAKEIGMMVSLCQKLEEVELRAKKAEEEAGALRSRLKESDSVLEEKIHHLGESEKEKADLLFKLRGSEKENGELFFKLEESERVAREMNARLGEAERLVEELRSKLRAISAISSETPSGSPCPTKVFLQLKTGAEIPDYLERFTIYQLMKLMEANGEYPASGYNKSYYLEALRRIKSSK